MNLTEADSQLVARAIRVSSSIDFTAFSLTPSSHQADACGATVDPELCAAALASLSLLPSPQIVYMYEVGDLASLLDPLVRHKDAWVRSASVGAWHEALLRPSILSTASQSAASANSYQEHWIKLSDSILDEDPR